MIKQFGVDKRITEINLGLAAEHLVCADLILQGYNVMLAAPGLPYDVLVDDNGKLVRVQVKATQGTRVWARGKGKYYRFGLRRSKGSRRRMDTSETDWFAFVALDTKQIAYVPIRDMVSNKGGIKILAEFKTRKEEYIHTYPNGNVHIYDGGRFIEDYSQFGGNCEQL